MCLTGKSRNCKTVGAVGRDLKFDSRVIETDSLAYIHTGYELIALILKYEYAVLYCIGEIMQGKAELAEGAEHAVGYLAPELALLYLNAAGKSRAVKCGGHQCAYALGSDIGSTRNYLYGLAPARIHLCYDKVVGIGMGLYIEYLSHYHIGYLCALLGVLLHL